jgi:hypothetical protein
MKKKYDGTIRQIVRHDAIERLLKGLSYISQFNSQHSSRKQQAPNKH